MVALKIAGELPAPDLETGPPRRPAPIQGRVNTNNLPYRPQLRITAGSSGETDAEAVAEMTFQGGVIGLRRRHRRLEQHPPINGQPPAVEGLHLVRNSDMSMQVRVAGAGVAVGERGGDQAAYVDLPDPVRALPGRRPSFLLQALALGLILSGLFALLLGVTGRLLPPSMVTSMTAELASSALRSSRALMRTAVQSPPP